jgi:hypothetical protein
MVSGGQPRNTFTSLQFQSPRSHPDWEFQPPLPTTRSVLPTLTYFRFKGVSEYLEDLVARVDAPRLNVLDVTFFNQIVFDTSLLAQFISRTPTPTFKAPHEASVFFHDSAPSASRFSGTGLSQASSVPLISTMEKLCIQSVPWPGPWKNGTQWLEFLHSFTAIKVQSLAPVDLVNLGLNRLFPRNSSHACIWICNNYDIL